MLYNDAVKDTFLKTKRKVLSKLFQLWIYQNWNNDLDETIREIEALNLSDLGIGTVSRYVILDFWEKGFTVSRNSRGDFEVQRIDDPHGFKVGYDLNFTPPALGDDAEAARVALLEFNIETNEIRNRYRTTNVTSSDGEIFEVTKKREE